MMKSFRQFVEQFVQISDEDFAQFQQRAKKISIARNQVITRPGEVEQYLYFVESGVVHNYFEKGKEIISTDIEGANSIMGSFVSFFTGTPSRYYVQALQPSVLIGISKTDLEYLYKHYPVWQRIGRILTSYFLLKQERIYLDSLRYSIRERLVRFAHANPDLINQVSQSRIASYLKIKPETYSRIKYVLQPETSQK